MSSFPFSKSPIATFKNWSIKLTSLYAQVTELCKFLEWGTLDITVMPESAMTFTITGQKSLNYFRLLDTVFFSASAVGTIGGVAASNLAFTIPFPISSDVPEYAFSTAVIDGGAILSGVGFVSTTREYINVYKGNGLVWTAGAAQFRCSGFYKRRTV